jgi:hypothetical protein
MSVSASSMCFSYLLFFWADATSIRILIGHEFLAQKYFMPFGNHYRFPVEIRLADSSLREAETFLKLRFSILGQYKGGHE